MAGIGGIDPLALVGVGAIGFGIWYWYYYCVQQPAAALPAGTASTLGLPKPPIVGPPESVCGLCTLYGLAGPCPAGMA